MIDKFKNKWEIFSSKQELTDFEVEHQRELKKAQTEMEQGKRHITATMNTEGFKLFYTYLQHRREVLRDKLERKEDPAVRAELKAIRSEISFFDNWKNVQL